MKKSPVLSPSVRLLALALGYTLIATPTGIGAAETPLADIPLANATTENILPNIYFILDNSGSMDWDYMPDYVNGSYCRSTGTSLTSCTNGDAPYYLSAFNRVYYNPMVNYTPPKNADNSDKTNYTTWTNVPYDGYGIQSGSSINLVTNYPERVACKNGWDDVNGSNCVSQIDGANAYSYPNGTYSNIKTRYGGPFYYTATVEWCSAQESSGPRFGKAGTCQAQKSSTYRYVRYSNWKRVNIVPSTTSYPGPNGTTRTYAQEMTNFANWHAWYRTRMQMTKTAVGQAFADIRGTPNASDPLDKNYFHARVGFSTISDKGATDSNTFLAINNFDTTQKNTWFTRLYKGDPTVSTPLRGALAKAGRIYAGKLGADPIQYSCQRNFTILSTDGYWNTNDETSTYGPTKEDGKTAVGDQDGVATATRPSFDALKKSSTLADVAYYYYHTDLRSDMPNNVPPAGTKLEEDDVATHQHMTTFTIGLGVDGNLTYQDGYKTATSGAYYDIKQGTKNWPDPLDASDEDRIDDLWHAAVNGRGTYFSARNPEALVNGLASALGAMEASSGSGAAAATSALEPTAGDNYIYVANYRTVAWEGELSAYTIDLSTGNISANATWKASPQLNSKIPAVGNTDTRAIYTSSGSTLKALEWANLTAAQKAYFDNTKLSQYLDWSAADKSTATGELMLNYVRGHNRYEDQERDVAFGSYNRLYRDRSTVLGDIVHGQPVYVQAPSLEFLDAGYAEFKAAQAGRTGMVYVGANDGMLHAFDAATGAESWAYVPPMIIKDLWRLADKDYATNHRYFVDGPIIVTDAFVTGSWKTILIGGLGKGGRGYYALDITTPSAPKVLWTFSADDNPNMGYSYGSPLVSKVDGRWVALLPSGYNNIPEGSNYPTADGKGYIFMVDAGTGALIKTLSTNTGSSGNPSGLGRINVKADDFAKDNTAVAAYGGDLFGNMWRFDLSAGTVSPIMTLGSSQAITAAPEIGEIDGKTVLFFGTGRYLGQDDLDNPASQSFYAVKDDGTSTISRGSMVAKVANGTEVGGPEVNWNIHGGWYLDLPMGKERVYLNAQLFFGTIMFSSIIPEASACQPGGSSQLYFLDYKSGGGVDGGRAIYTFTSPIVGLTVIKLPGGTPKVFTITADGNLKGGAMTLPISTGNGGGNLSGNRMMWRELAN